MKRSEAKNSGKALQINGFRLYPNTPPFFACLSSVEQNCNDKSTQMR